jgi:hypothetical protein
MAGYTSAESFTALLGVATAWMTFLVARKLDLKFSWSAIDQLYWPLASLYFQ